MMRFATGFCSAAVLLLLSIQPARADLIPLASYQFQGTLAADQVGLPALNAIDPLGTNGFQVATLYGQNRQVYQFNGDASPVANQGGLTLSTTGLLTPDNYSVEMVFSFDSDQNYRRILDPSGRTSDNGLYVDPNNHLDLYDTTPH
ncbi:MAG: PEP-CTERM sorting domain-containing protein, partial [Isosphaeraceae bacterium]